MQEADEALVAEALNGSTEAAAELFQRYWLGAWRTAFAVTGRREAADDVAQDAFQRAFAALANFDRHRSFGAWLHRIVVNRALDFVRSERRLTALDEAGDPAAEWLDDDRLRDRELFDAVARLSPERRVLIVLRYWLDHSSAEIAEMLNLPLGTVSSRLTRTLAELRTQLEVHHVE
jgi:RNA polymerase sigma-70 factor (ECF subfamily)